MSRTQESRAPERIITPAPEAPNPPQVELNIKARSNRLHFGEWLLLSIQEVELYIEGQEAPITVFRGCRSLDLFSHKKTPELLGASAAPEGEVSRLRVKLSRVALWVSRERVLPIGCALDAESGLELTPEKPLRARAREVLSLALLFDTELSLKRDEPLLRLSPVVRLRRLLQR